MYSASLLSKPGETSVSLWPGFPEARMFPSTDRQRKLEGCPISRGGEM